MAWLPPPYQPVHRRLRLPHLPGGDDSPLNSAKPAIPPKTCLSPRLQTQRRPRYGPSGICLIPSPPSARISPSPSPDACSDVLAASEPTALSDTYDAVGVNWHRNPHRNPTDRIVMDCQQQKGQKLL